MKWTSTIAYTFEDIDGSVETFKRLSEVVGITIMNETITLKLGDNDRGDTLEVPLISGYNTPYVSDVTDEIGTEHYVYYEQRGNLYYDRELRKNEYVFNKVQDYPADNVSIEELIEFSNIVNEDRSLTAQETLKEWEKYHTFYNK